MIYLDNNSTTPIDPEVFEAMEPYLKEEYGNPSSKYYTKAVNASKAVEEAREQVAKLINAKPKEIVFTSGASESNNFIIKGVADYKKYIEKKGNHIITSKAEHKSVLQTCKFLNGEVYMNEEKKSLLSNLIAAFDPTNSTSFLASSRQERVDRGYRVTFLDVNQYGQVDKDDLANSINKDTILVSIIWGNNELGSLNDIDALASVTRDKGVLFHSDATQVLGKIHIDVTKTPVDFLSFSAHKLHGPKGIGAAYIRSQNDELPKITALIHGGSQEKGYRAGTLAVHNIVGFGKACEIAKRDMDEYISRIKQYELNLRKALKAKFENIIFLGDLDNNIPGTISFILSDKHNEIYIKNIADKIAISSGSACSITEPSHILAAIGMEKYNTNFFRISLNKYIVENVKIEDIIDNL